ncbi:MAG: carboxypeptidase-like regulatory domain-containing protein [Patescibacteria group bacterium]|nr:carboxypeptidase-like regulatory domain-containing protein [Patescibacteria group bacterium]
MLKILIFSLLLLLFINSTNTNQNIISGKILNKNTREELAGVRIISDCDTVYSDFDGDFKIKTVSDTTNLSFSLISYEPENLKVIKIEEKLFVKN